MRNQTDTAIQAALEAIPSLASLAPGGVWNTSRPQGGAFPVLVFTRRPGAILRSFSGIWGRAFVYDVKAIGVEATDGDTLNDLEDAITTALDTQPLAISGFQHMATQQTGEIGFPETFEGVRYLQAGGTFTVTVAKP